MLMLLAELSAQRFVVQCRRERLAKRTGKDGREREREIDTNRNKCGADDHCMWPCCWLQPTEPLIFFLIYLFVFVSLTSPIYYSSYYYCYYYFFSAADRRCLHHHPAYNRSTNIWKRKSYSFFFFFFYFSCLFVT